jgi:peroxiredoxin
VTRSGRPRRVALHVALACWTALSFHASLAVGQPALQPGKLVAVAKPAPALDLAALDGTRHTLAALEGRVVVVNFWATWCAPCVAEMPALDRMQKLLADAGVVVLGVNFAESTARMEQFAKKTPVGFPLLADPNRDAIQAFGVRVLPSTFIVGPDGRIRFTVVGEIDWLRSDVIESIRKLARAPGAAGAAQRR